MSILVAAGKKNADLPIYFLILSEQHGRLILQKNGVIRRVSFLWYGFRFCSVCTLLIRELILGGVVSTCLTKQLRDISKQSEALDVCWLATYGLLWVNTLRWERIEKLTTKTVMSELTIRSTGRVTCCACHTPVNSIRWVLKGQRYENSKN